MATLFHVVLVTVMIRLHMTWMLQRMDAPDKFLYYTPWSNMTPAHCESLKCVGTSSELFSKSPNEKTYKIGSILLFMWHLKNEKNWSQGTFFQNLESPFLEEASQDCLDGCF